MFKMFSKTIIRNNHEVKVEGIASNKYIITIYNQDKSIKYIGSIEKYDALAIDKIFEEIK